ncbi:flavin monoamine oxidase family protein [Corynebacterium pelargi]|uniref:Pseudooxynicotine oxidase n=1 Tax=Corynebacterium pelargi TaxID=1471400 RepID=A0A410WA76_9CORY|nr:NAD(P)/FAD-dependent oxidoreductase [Corynebacterium pelargi]QAU52850.1 Pseudooxynicotine oxidase [Corynebacterium pelargi]GGG76544.1 putative flavin-containing monoamine oxidase AofH [Corynebacterium pelargi]
MKGTVGIIGAGFAGLISARELERLGYTVEIFEARDRIGGRTWTAQKLGHELEVGGTWVHWMQPFIWSEITRYGAEIVSSPVCDEAFWIVGDTVHSGVEADVDKKLAGVQSKIFERSRELFPLPHAPWTNREAVAKADTGTVLDCVRNGEFSEEEVALANAYWNAGYNGESRTASPLMAAHWAALSDHRLSLLDDQTLRYKLEGGMKSIYSKIRNDIRGEVHLNTRVTKVDDQGDCVEITLADGTTRQFEQVVVTLPIGALKTIDFIEGLPDHAKEAMVEGWNCTGHKVWVKIKGHRKILAYAPDGHPLALLRSEYFMEDDTTICVGFGPDHAAIDLNSVEAVQRAVDAWDANIEVVSTFSHDWVEDEFTGQTWATPRTGQFLHGHPEKLRHGNLIFAGSDWAAGWNSFVDGAIETGFRAAREINEHRPL